MNMNARALANSAHGFIKMLNTKKTTTISYVVNDWNVCVDQSGFTGVYDFPTDYKRKAHLIADLERCADQLERLVYAEEVKAAVAQVKDEQKREHMVQDIQKGMVVMNPNSFELNTVKAVHDYSCYFDIEFVGDMNVQRFDRGETLIVCESIAETQTSDVLINNKAESMTTPMHYNTMDSSVLEQGDKFKLETVEGLSETVYSYQGNNLAIDTNDSSIHRIEPMSRIVMVKAFRH